ncbi:MAG: sortase [Candidatus Levyibacteriota bacterium]
MTRNEMIRFLILRSIGNFMVLFALFAVGSIVGPAMYYEVNFRIQLAKGITYTVANPFGIYQNNSGVNSGLPSLFLPFGQQQILIPKDTHFAIMIPKIGANARVFPNVDAGNEKEFLPILKKGVAHAKGSSLPGLRGTTYLFAHSTDSLFDVGQYNAIFYLLKDLVPGDQIVVFFENKRYNYAVSDKKIIDPNDVSFLLKGTAPESELVLQTCWPPGTTWKRLMVIAKPV